MRKIFLLIATGVSTGFALLAQSPALSEFARIAATDAANTSATATQIEKRISASRSRRR